MQQINNLPDDFHLTRYFKPFYEAYSVKALPQELTVDARLRRVLSIVNEKAALPLRKFTDDKFIIPRDENAVCASKMAYVAFSGGKDCLATAIRAQQNGYQPTLVYIGGVNKSLPSERRHAEEVAKAAGFPLLQLRVTITGDKEWHEHPLKNILILCLLIDAGLRQGVTAYGFGSTFDDDSTYGSLDYDLSDSFDMLKAFAHFVRGFLPEFRLLGYMCNTMQSFYTIVRYNKAIIPLLSTCITPDFRKPMIRKHNIEKYGADVVSQTGCGGCYKCADEYFFKQKFGLVRYDAAYAKKLLQAKAAFDRTGSYRKDFDFDHRKYNRWGGFYTPDVQVLCDRCGYYIGRLVFDAPSGKWFTHQAYGHRHWQNREEAEAVCQRFKSIYRL